MYFRFILVNTLFFLTVGCSSVGMLIPSGTLTTDSINMSKSDLSGPGPQEVVSTRMMVSHQGENLSVVVYQPAHSSLHAPAIVFLPGWLAPDDQYESYARALASRGFVVAVHGWYGIFTNDIELARNASIIADWLITVHGVDAKKIGIAGHSMGGKDAILAAAQNSVFASVVAIDPDDNGEVSVVHGLLTDLRVPLLLIGAEVAWQASSVCAPMSTNYLRFFERAPAGTVELTLRDADHVQVMDEPDRFGYGICRCGTADSRQVRITARRATVGFFVQHLLNGPVLLTPPASEALIRVAQGNQYNGKIIRAALGN